MSGERLRIAWVTPTIPVPPRCGPEVVTAGVLESLRQAATVDVFTLVPPADLEARDKRLRALQDVCDVVHAFLWNPSRSLAARWRAAIAGVPLPARRMTCPTLVEELAAYCRKYPEAVLVADHWRMAPSVLQARQPGQRCILHTHHAARAVLQGLPGRSWFERWLVARTSRRVGSYERRLLEEFDRVVTLSELDAQRLRQLAPHVPHERLVCIRPGIDRLPGPAGWSTTPPRMLVAGDFAWAPNRVGLDRFLAEVWPAAAQHWSEARLVIAGGGLHEPTRKQVAMLSNVDLHGHVADLGPLYSACRLAVAPIEGGAGVALRVLHALARGVPTLATADAVAGLGLSPGSVLAYDSAETFVRQAERVWNQPAAWQRQSREAQGDVLARYDCAESAARWSQLLTEITPSPRQNAVRALKRREAA